MLKLVLAAVSPTVSGAADLLPAIALERQIRLTRDELRDLFNADFIAADASHPAH